MTVDIFATGESDKGKDSVKNGPSQGFDWFEHNVVNPAFNAVVVSSINGAIELASLACNDKKLCDQKWQYRKTDEAAAGSLEFWTQSGSNLVGSLLSYGVASKLTGGLLRKAGTALEKTALNTLAKSSIATDAKLATYASRAINKTGSVFGSDHMAQIIGGTLVDGTREVKPGETDFEHLGKRHLGNFAGGFVGNAVYEGGNWGAGKVKIAQSLGLRSASKLAPIASEIARMPVRAVTGYVGNAGNSLLSQQVGEDKISIEQCNEAGASGAVFNTFLPYAHKLLAHGTKLITKNVPAPRHFAGEDVQSQVTKDLIEATALTNVKEVQEAHADSGSKVVAWPRNSEEAVKAHELMHAYTKKDLATIRLRNEVRDHIKKGELEIAQEKYLAMRVNGEIAARKAEEHVRNGSVAQIEKLVRHDYQKAEPELYGEILADPKYKDQFKKDFENLRRSNNSDVNEQDFLPTKKAPFVEIKTGTRENIIMGDFDNVKQAVECAIKWGLSLANADLRNADLSGVDLQGVDLTYADLSGANLKGAKLDGADLRNTVLDKDSLGSVSLEGTKFLFSDFIYLGLGQHGGFEHLSLTIEKENKEPIFTTLCKNAKEAVEAAAKAQVDLSGADLSYIDLTGANLEGANLKGASLRGSSLTGASLRNANLQGTEFYGTSIDGADLTGAQVRLRDFGSNRLHHANFDHLNFIINNADRSKVEPVFVAQGKSPKEVAEAAVKAKISLKEADLYEVNFDGADLEGADLQGSQLLGASFRGANLKGANLQNTNLNQAILDGANIDGATIGIAQLEQLKPSELKKVIFDRLNFVINSKDNGEPIHTARGRTASEAVEAALQAKVSLEGAFLDGVDLSGANLSGANLRGSRLRQAFLMGANLSGACLEGADFQYANLKEAYLQGADLSNADFNGAQLEGAQFNVVDLSKVDLGSADYDELNLVICNNQGEEMYKVKRRDASQAVRAAVSDGRSMENANLSRTDLSDADLDDVDFSNANLQFTKFHGAELRGSKFDGASLTGAMFHVSQLGRIDLDPAKYEYLELSIKSKASDSPLFEGHFKTARDTVKEAIKQNVSMKNAVLNGVDLSGLDFEGASFKNAEMESVNLEGANLKGADFTNTDLTFANLKNADLQKAILIDPECYTAVMAGANLRGAVISGDRFRYVVFDGADLTNASIMKANVQGASFVGTKGIPDLILHNDLHTLRYHPLDLLPEKLSARFKNASAWEQTMALRAWKQCLDSSDKDFAMWLFDENFDHAIAKMNDRLKHAYFQRQPEIAKTVRESLPAELSSRISTDWEKLAALHAWKETLKVNSEYVPNGQPVPDEIGMDWKSRFEIQKHKAEHFAEEVSERHADMRQEAVNLSDVIHCMPTGVIQPHHAKLLYVLQNDTAFAGNYLALLKCLDPASFRSSIDAITEFSKDFKNASLEDIRTWLGYQEVSDRYRWALQLALTFQSKPQLASWLNRNRKLGFNMHDTCDYLPNVRSDKLTGLSEYLLKYMPDTDKRPGAIPDEVASKYTNASEWKKVVLSDAWRQTLNRNREFADEWMKERIPVPEMILREYVERLTDLQIQRMSDIDSCMAALQKIAANWEGLTEEQRKLSPTAILEVLDSRLFPNVRHSGFARECHNQSVSEKDFPRFENQFLASLDVPSPFPLEKRWQSNDFRGRFVPREDSRGLWLGRHTGCCQHPNGVGKTCAWYGQESPNSGFFVVEDADGKVIAQSWAWISDDGGLCFDNIEATQGALYRQSDEILNIYNQAAADLSSQYHTITVGDNYSKLLDPNWKMASKNLPLPSDYSGYSDSQNSGQHLLAHNPEVPKRVVVRGDVWTRGALESDRQAMKNIEKQCYPSGWHTLDESDGDYGVVLQSKDKGIVGYAVVDTNERYIADLAVLPEHRSESMQLVKSLFNYMRRFPGEWTAHCREETSMKLLELYAKRGRLQVLDKAETGYIGDQKRYAVTFKLLDPAPRDELVIPPLPELTGSIR